MTSTVRSVRVVMEADVAGYIAKIEAAGKATDQAFSNSERRLSGVSGSLREVDASATKAATGLKSVEPSLKGVETRSNSASKEVDKLSGRLRLFRDIGITIGPALIPLTTGILPALTGGLAGIGAGAVGIGVAVLALHGLKDGIKALDAYKLDPTIENLAKLRQQEALLGPAGTQFLHYIDDLEPKLRGLQQVARAGWFPGLETGIDDLLQRLPLFRGLVKSVSTELGVLSADAGQSLSSSEWRPFFQYVRSNAAPILDDFARSAGNVGLAVANMLVQFGPASSGFADGLEQDTQRFADWSKTLDQNQGFQHFLTGVRQDGHEALQLLDATVSALGGIVEAAQPVGQVVLPVLTELVHLFAMVANSDSGPVLYAAAAGMIAYSRATAIAEKVQSKYGSSFSALYGNLKKSGVGLGLLAVNATGVADKVGLAHAATGAFVGDLAAGPYGAAIGGAIGLVLDFKDAHDQLTSSITSSEDALRSGDQSAVQQQLAGVNAQLQKLHENGNVDWFGAPSWKDAKQIIPAIEAGVAKLDGTEQRLKGSQSELNGALKEGGSVADLLGEGIGRTGAQLQVAAGDANALSGALAHLAGWFSKSDAVYAYKDAVDALTKGLKDGFTRTDAEQLNQVGESLLQVANQIKSPAAQATFLSHARSELEGISKSAGPAAKSAIQEVINKLDSKGLTHPIKPQFDGSQAEAGAEKTSHKVAGAFDIMNALKAKPTVGADDSPFQQIYGTVKHSMAQADHLRASPKVTVDPGNSISLIGTIARLLNGLHDRTITVRTNHIGGVTSSAGGHSASVAGGADGMTVPGPRYPYGDKILIHAAPGEEIITNRHGEADQFRADRAAGRIPGYADGGTAGTPPTDGTSTAAHTHTKRRPDPHIPLYLPGDTADILDHLGKAGGRLEQVLKRLSSAADKVQKSYDKEKSKLDDLVSQRSSLASSVGGAYLHDPFGNGLSGLDAQVGADTGDLDAMTAALATLVHNGLDPKSALYQQLAASADVNTAQQLAQLSAAGLQGEANRYQHVIGEANALGGTVAGQALDGAIRDQTKATDKLEGRMHSLEDAIKDLHQHFPRKVGDEVFTASHDGTRKGAEDGARAAAGDRSRTTQTLVRTGGGRGR